MINVRDDGIIEIDGTGLNLKLQLTAVMKGFLQQGVIDEEELMLLVKLAKADSETLEKMVDESRAEVEALTQNFKELGEFFKAMTEDDEDEEELEEEFNPKDDVDEMLDYILKNKKRGKNK